MSLRVFEQTSPGVYEEFSINDAFDNPITTVHHGKNGDTFERKLYIGRTIGDEHSYADIVITPVSKTEDDDIGSGANIGATGWGVKIMLDEGHTPSESEWDATYYGTSISTEDIATDVRIPFWFRIESPTGISVGNKRNISLLVTFIASRF